MTYQRFAKIQKNSLARDWSNMLSFFVFIISLTTALSQDQCGIGSNQCHEAAKCVQANGANTCVCNDWYVGDGYRCYGFCNSTCSTSDTTRSCITNAFGRSCLSSSPFTASDLPAPKNVRVTWVSSKGLTLAWDYVENAYSYVVTLRNFRTSTYITIVPVAGFGNLQPNTEYTFEVIARDSIAKRSHITSFTARTGNVSNVRKLYKGPPNANECATGKHKCHVEAKCKNLRRGYSCKCNGYYIGDASQCIGICGSDCSGKSRCVPTEFGSTCFCKKSSDSINCKVPQPPPEVRLKLQSPTSLVFEWDSQKNIAQYVAVLKKRVGRKEVKVGLSYVTYLPFAAFTNLEQGTNYTVEVSSNNLITPDGRSTSFKASTGLSCLLENTNCHRNSTCLLATGKCVCNEGFFGNGLECEQIYAQDFHQTLTGNDTNEDVILNTLLRRFLRKNDNVLKITIKDLRVASVNYRVFFTNIIQGVRVFSSINSAILQGEPKPLKDICPHSILASYSFNQTSHGNTQESTEKCMNGEPIARIMCARNDTWIAEARLLQSQFDPRTLIIEPCNDIITTKPTTTTEATTTATTMATTTTSTKPPTTTTTTTKTATTSTAPSKTTKTTTTSSARPTIIDEESVKYNLAIVDVEVPHEAVDQAIAQLNISDVMPTFEIHDNDDEFPSNYSVSYIVTIDIGINTTIQNLSNPIRIVNVRENTSYGQIIPGDSLLNKRVVQQCVFWDEQENRWSGEGCCLNNYLAPPTCECNHLSSFALLVSTVEVPADVALSVVSDIGCGLSIVGLFATFWTIFLHREARGKIPNQIQLHFTFNLFITYTLFLFGVSKVENSVLCTIIAAALHYFFLVSWMWIAIYSNRLYVALIQVFKQTSDSFMQKASLFAYGIPLVIVAANIGLTIGYFDLQQVDDKLCNPSDVIMESSFYRADNMCWLRSYSLFYGFLTIIGLILLNNIIVLVLVCKEMCGRQQIRSTKSKRSKYADVISAVSLSFTLGITWLFGFLMLLSTDPTYNLVMNWLFAIFNASQGFVIWYVTCVKRTDMREFWWNPIKKFWLRLFGKICCKQLKPKGASDEDSSGTDVKLQMISASSQTTESTYTKFTETRTSSIRSTKLFQDRK